MGAKLGEADGMALGTAVGVLLGAAVGVGLGTELIVGYDEGTLLMVPFSRQTAQESPSPVDTLSEASERFLSVNKTNERTNERKTLPTHKNHSRERFLGSSRQ